MKLRSVLKVCSFFGSLILTVAISLTAQIVAAASATSQMPDYNFGSSGQVFASGMIPLEENQKITPLVKNNSRQRAVEDQVAAILLDVTAQASNLETHKIHTLEAAKELKDVTDALAAAKSAGKSTAQLESDRRIKADSLRTWEAAKESVQNSYKQTFKKFQDAQKDQADIDGKSGGWVLSDSATEKESAMASGLKCAEGERLVLQQGAPWGRNLGCLNSAGYMTHTSLQVNGKSVGMDIVYTRDGDTLKKVSVSGADGKVISERTIGAKEETTKWFDKGVVRSSCTTFGDEKSRAQNSYGSYGGGTYGGGTPPVSR